MSGLRDIGRTGREEDHGAEDAAREEGFQKRVRGQRHLRTHGPLLRAVVEMTGGLKADPAEFERRVVEARNLAVRVAATVNGKPVADVDVMEAQPFRHECAEAVAYAWRQGTALDADAFVAAMVEAVRLADEASDYDPVPWKLLTPAGNMALTLVPSVMRLRQVVDVYDFRLGRDAVVAYLSRLVGEEAAEAVNTILPPPATLADRRGLYQSVLREYTFDLRAVYERTARQAVAELVGLPEAERDARLARMRPLESVEAAFRDVARRNTALNAAAVQAAMAETVAAAGRTADTRPGR